MVEDCWLYILFGLIVSAGHLPLILARDATNPENARLGKICELVLQFSMTAVNPRSILKFLYLEEKGLVQGSNTEANRKG